MQEEQSKYLIIAAVIKSQSNGDVSDKSTLFQVRTCTSLDYSWSRHICCVCVLCALVVYCVLHFGFSFWGDICSYIFPEISNLEFFTTEHK